MIATSSDGYLRFITQNDHAHLASQLLALWVTDGLPEHPRRRELLFAVREHDNGWLEADSAPFCDRETGRPHDFMSLPRDERIEVWCRGPERYAEREPYASLLITRHALELHDDHRGDPAWDDAFAFWSALAAELLEASGVPEAEASADYRWLELADLLSLATCCGFEEPVELHGFRGRVAGGVLELDPFPLAGATTFRVPVRRLAERRFTSDADLAVELASTPWQEWTVRVVPPP